MKDDVSVYILEGILADFEECGLNSMEIIREYRDRC